MVSVVETSTPDGGASVSEAEVVVNRCVRWRMAVVVECTRGKAPVGIEGFGAAVVLAVETGTPGGGASDLEIAMVVDGCGCSRCSRWW